MGEIVTVIYPKQEQAYYDAKERGDVYAMNLFYRHPIYRSPEQIQSDIRTKALVDNFEAEMKRIEEMDPKLLEIETKLRVGYYTQPLKIKRPSKINFFDWLFGNYRKK